MKRRNLNEEWQRTKGGVPDAKVTNLNARWERKATAATDEAEAPAKADTKAKTNKAAKATANKAE